LSSSGRLKSHASSPKELKDDGYLSVGVARCLSCDPGDHVDDGSPSAVINRNPRANPGDHNDEGIARIRGSTPDNHKDEVQFRPESLEFHSSNLAITDSSRYDWRTAPTLYRWRTLRRHPAPTLAVSAVDIWVARSRTYGVPSTDRAPACSTDFSAKTPAVAGVAGVAGVAEREVGACAESETRRSKVAEKQETIAELCTMARHAHEDDIIDGQVSGSGVATCPAQISVAATMTPLIKSMRYPITDATPS